MVIKVSVVIPLLNPDTNLALCLDSVLSQSFSDFEVICVYNSLENKTQNLLEHYQKFDSRIKLIHSDSPNYSGIKNCGLENSNGEYIIFLKPSDRLSSIALSVLIENANKYNSQVILFDFAWGKTSGNKEVNTVTSIKEFKNFSSGKNKKEVRIADFFSLLLTDVPGGTFWQIPDTPPGILHSARSPALSADGPPLPGCPIPWSHPAPPSCLSPALPRRQCSSCRFLHR